MWFEDAMHVSITPDVVRRRHARIMNMKNMQCSCAFALHCLHSFTQHSARLLAQWMQHHCHLNMRPLNDAVTLLLYPVLVFCLWCLTTKYWLHHNEICRICRICQTCDICHYMEHRLKYVKYAQYAKYAHPLRRMNPSHYAWNPPFSMTNSKKFKNM